VLQKSWTGTQREVTRAPGEPKNGHAGKSRKTPTVLWPQAPEQRGRRTENTTAPDSKAGHQEPPLQAWSKTFAAGSGAEVLNTATRQQLLSVYGIGPVLADRIMQNRPYTSAYEVVEKGIIPESIFVQLRKQLLDQHSA
jgi:DNA uptake protein ComE-like DNA-binding protein